GTTVPPMQKPSLSLAQQISAGATLPHVTHRPVPWAASEVHLPAARVSPKTAWHQRAQNALLPKTLRIAPRPTTPPIDGVRMVLSAWRREVDFASSLVNSSNFVGFIFPPFIASLGNKLAARQAFFLQVFRHERHRRTREPDFFTAPSKICEIF